MRDYKKHLTLLPHKWQVIGLVVFAVMFACEVIQYTVLKQYEGEIWYAYAEMAVLVLGNSFLLVACFSQERTEDEYVTTVRYRALTISVMILIVSCGIAEIIGWRFHRYTTIQTISMMKGEGDGFFLGNNPILYSLLGILGYFRYAANLELLYIVLVKILKRIGCGTAYSSLLLQNRYKKTGWWLLGISIVLVLVTILINKYVNVLCWYGKMLWLVKLYLWVCLILPLMAYTGVFMVCLSREQQEDEFIRHIRVRLLVVFVIAYALLSIFEELNLAGRHLYRLIEQPTIENHGYYLYSHISRQLLLWLMWIPGISVVYALVLRKVLSNNLKESGNEE